MKLLILGLSSVNAGCIMPMNKSLKTTGITLTTNDLSRNLDTIIVKTPSDYEDKIKVYGTKYSENLTTKGQRDDFLLEHNANSILIKKDHKYLGEMLSDVSLVLTCGRFNTIEDAKILARNSFDRKCIPVVVLDNDYETFLETQKILEHLAPERFLVKKGVIHCVVPPTKYDGENNNILLAESYTCNPYIVLPPLPEGLIDLSVTSRIGIQPKLICAKNELEMKYHVVQKAGYNSLHQILCAKAQLFLAKNCMDRENVMKTSFRDYFTLVEGTEIEEFIKDYAEEFYAKNLKNFEDEFAVKDKFIGNCIEFGTLDLLKDTIGRGLKDGSRFKVYSEYFSKLDEVALPIILEYKDFFEKGK